MKVSLYGNVLNLSFLLGLFLRRKGHDARVFIDEGGFEQFKPEWECVDSHESAALPLTRVNVDVKRLLLGGRAERRLRAELAEADVVQTFGEDVVWSAGCGVPDTVLSIGDDLDILPFRRDNLRIGVYAAVLRRAQRRCTAVCYTMPPQESSCRALGLERARFLPCAIPIDSDRWAPLAEGERTAARERLGIPRDSLVVFQPSRQEWTCPEFPGSNHKGNDRALRAFARFVKCARRDAVLLAVAWGRDMEASQALAADLGLDGKIQWIPQQNKRGLRECFGASDIVADQFTYGFYGISALEAMSVGRPVLIYLQPDSLEAFGIESPPVVSVRSEEEIFGALCGLAENPQDARDLGARARQWIVDHHGWERVVDRYIGVYRDIRGA
ncbi:MAG: glycosyltransferase family 4 protein [candidate division NC10 bacterium]|nr:glycosyltransferase family 4 protein [candidate division NC10 bacterium]